MSAKTKVDVSKGFVNAEIPVRDSYGMPRTLYINVVQGEGTQLISIEDAEQLVTLAVEQALSVSIED